MKINPIMAVLAAVFGIGGALYAYSFAGLSADLATNGSITLVSSILGLIGIYLFEKDYKFAIAQYTVAGLGILIGTSLVGILGFIFYIVAAILSYVEKDKSGKRSDNTFEDIRFYGNEKAIRQKYPDFPTNKAKNTIYWAVPVITLILIILVGVIGDMSYQNDLQAKADSIELDNVTSDLKVSYGYYEGGVHGTLSSQKDITNAQIKGVWYKADGTQIDETYDTSLISEIKSGQKYQINIPYYRESSDVPGKVVIEVYENFDSTPLYNKTVNFN